MKKMYIKYKIHCRRIYVKRNAYTHLHQSCTNNKTNECTCRLDSSNKMGSWWDANLNIKCMQMFHDMTCAICNTGHWQVFN